MFADQAHELIVFNDVLMKYVPLVLDSDFFSREFGDNDQAILVSSLVLNLADKTHRDITGSFLLN